MTNQDQGAPVTAAGITASDAGTENPGRPIPPVTEEDVLAAWRAFYPGWREPGQAVNGFDATMDQTTLAALRRVLENDRRRTANAA
jgi:hypothetical protein